MTHDHMNHHVHHGHAGHQPIAPASAGSEFLDPVCGMTVDPAQARSAEHAGKTYYFCSEKCRTKFAAGRDGRVRSDDGRPGCERRGTQDRHDRRDLSQSASHGFQPAGQKRGPGRLIGRTRGGMNTKLHAITDANGRPLSFFITAGQIV